MGNLSEIVECPVCGEKVDIKDKEGALIHMEKDDDAHKKHFKEIKLEVSLNAFNDHLHDPGILRRFLNMQEIQESEISK